MFIYHFNRLIRSRLLWGFFAIIISIAFIAVGSCFQAPQEALVAGRIGRARISAEDFENAILAIRGFGRNRDHETPARIVDRRAWEQIAARLTAEQSGMASSREEIRDALREAPAFQGPNGFDLQRYRLILADQGLTPDVYERLVAHQLALMKCASLVETANWVSSMELEAELAAMTDRFTVQVVSVSNAFVNADLPLTDEEYRAYYEQNQDSFALPDRVAVRYVAVPVTNFLARVTVSEEDMLEYYDSHINTFTRVVTNDVTEVQPFEEVRERILADLKLEEARHCAETSVVFTVFGRFEDATAKPFETLAKNEGLTILTSPLFGLDEPLFFVENARAFAEAAFDLDPDRADARLGVVKGENYIYVLERAERSPAHTPAFEDVLNDVRARVLDQARRKAFDTQIAGIRDGLLSLLAEGKGFAESAAGKGLNVSTSLTYTVSDIQNNRFDHHFAVAYGAMTLAKGELSEPVPASAGESLLIYVQDRQPGDALAAEMMRGQVRSSMARRRGSDLFGDWLAWNLARKDFRPTRALDEEDDPGIAASQDEDGEGE